MTANEGLSRPDTWQAGEDEVRAAVEAVVSRYDQHRPGWRPSPSDVATDVVAAVSHLSPRTDAEDGEVGERCAECGPGYRIGDDGCRHTAPVPPAPVGDETDYEIAFRFSDGESFTIDDLRAGRGLFADEVPVIVARPADDGYSEWVALGDDFRPEHDPHYDEEA